MTITKCPQCQRPCFTDATECQQCATLFERGLLNRQANDKERRFVTKSYALFAGLFLIPVVALVVNFSGLFGS